MNWKRTHIDGLDVAGFEELYKEALKIQDNTEHLKAAFILLGLGRLTLSIVELQHLREAWINWERGEIQIPKHDPCACRRCCILAERQWLRAGFNNIERYDGESFSDVDNEDFINELDPSNLEEIIYLERFRPANTSRTIPFGWSQRITGVLVNFFDRVGPYLAMTQDEINNLIKYLAASADLNSKTIGAKELTKTSNQFYADAGVKPKIYRDVTGLVHLHKAEEQVKKRGDHRTNIGYQVLGDGQGHTRAPPVPTDKPREDYPIVCNPLPMDAEPFNPREYDASLRLSRAEAFHDRTYSITHPRDAEIPESRRYFPDELSYECCRHDLPGHSDDDFDHPNLSAEDIRRDGFPEIDKPTINEYIRPHEVGDIDYESYIANEGPSSQSRMDNIWDMKSSKTNK